MGKEFNVDYDAIGGTGEGGVQRGTTPVVGAVNKAMNGSTESRREKVLIEVDPKRTRMWKFADRTESDEELDLSDLKESMAVGKKQRIPALARKVEGEDGVDYELIYGRRRRAICLELGRNLLIELTEEDDQACAAAMKVENNDRKDITPMQKAKSYMDQFDGGLYKSGREMARNLDVNSTSMTRFLKAAVLWKCDRFVALVGSVKDVGIKDAEAIAYLKEDQPEVYASAIERVMDDETLVDKSADAKAKALLKALKKKDYKVIDKTVSFDGAEVKLKTDKKGNVTLKIPAGFVDKNKKVLANFMAKVREEIE